MVVGHNHWCAWGQWSAFFFVVPGMEAYIITNNFVNNRLLGNFHDRMEVIGLYSCILPDKGLS